MIPIAKVATSIGLSLGVWAVVAAESPELDRWNEQLGVSSGSALVLVLESWRSPQRVRLQAEWRSATTRQVERAVRTSAKTRGLRMIVAQVKETVGCR